jgi:peroxiredoxin family protein
MDEEMTIIVFSNDLDRVLASFILSTGAATMGLKPTMFFTFWGLNVLKKQTTRNPAGWIRKMMSLMNRRNADSLKLSQFHMLGIGTAFMKKIMNKSKIPSVPEMIALAKELGVRIIACTTTMEIMGVSQDDLIEEVDNIAGVATYLSTAKGSKVNLFI